MINVFVRLEVKDFDKLYEFETQAAKLMKKHNGSIISAFETVHNLDGTGEEIHILQFENEEHFMNYRKDDNLNDLSELRQKAIASAEVKTSIILKKYPY